MDDEEEGGFNMLNWIVTVFLATMWFGFLKYDME